MMVSCTCSKQYTGGWGWGGGGVEVGVGGGRGERENICPLAIQNQTSTISMQVSSLVKMHWYLLLIIRKWKYRQMDCWLTYNRWTDGRPTLNPCHYRVVGYKKKYRNGTCSRLSSFESGTFISSLSLFFTGASTSSLSWKNNTSTMKSAVYIVLDMGCSSKNKKCCGSGERGAWVFDRTFFFIPPPMRLNLLFPHYPHHQIINKPQHPHNSVFSTNWFGTVFRATTICAEDPHQRK